MRDQLQKHLERIQLERFSTTRENQDCEFLRRAADVAMFYRDFIEKPREVMFKVVPKEMRTVDKAIMETHVAGFVYEVLERCELLEVSLKEIDELVRYAIEFAFSEVEGSDENGSDQYVNYEAIGGLARRYANSGLLNSVDRRG